MHGPLPTTLRLIRCRVAGRSYALDANGVRGVGRADQLRREDGARGLVGATPGPDGEVPIHALARILGDEARTVTGTEYVVYLHDAEGPWGLLVDQVTQLGSVAGRSVETLPTLLTGPATRYVRGALCVDQEWLLLLDTNLLRTGAIAPEASATQPATRPASEPLAATAGMAKASGGQLVLFSTAESAPDERPLTLGLSITQIAEIVEPLPVVPVPGAPGAARGFVPWRGRLLPILDLGRRLGMSSTSGEGHSRLIIRNADRPESQFGFFVRPTIRVVRLPLPCRPCDRDLPVAPGLVRGAVELEQETLVIPDLQELAVRGT